MKSGYQDGNILVYVLIGIVLIGLLTAAIRNVGGYKDNIDTEDLIIKAGQVQRYGSELAKGVTIILEKSVSEADLRFAPPDDNTTEYGDIAVTPENQVFSPDGGRATYKAPPEGVNDGSPWEFFGTSRIPQVGSDKAELIAVLPNVTAAFCTTMNAQLGFAAGPPPLDDIAGTPPCVKGAGTDRFAGSYDDATPNTLDAASFSKLPSYQACVICRSDGTYNYFYVLMAR